MKPQLIFSVVVKGSIVPPEADEILQHNKALCEKSGIEFILFTPENTSPLAPAYFSDHYRNSVAECTPYALYTDWDCRLLEIPSFPEPEMASFAMNRNDTYDNFLFYSGDCSYCRELQERTKGREDLRGVFYELLNNDRNKGKFSVIPEGFYLHKGLGKGRS